MGLGDMVNKAKEALTEHADQVDGALDKGADALKERTGDGTDAKIDSAVDKAKGFLDDQQK